MNNVNKKILDSLDLVLIANENGGVDVQLNAQVIPSQKKMAYVVIQVGKITSEMWLMKLNELVFQRRAK